MAKSNLIYVRPSDVISEGCASTLQGSVVTITKYRQGWRIKVVSGDKVQVLSVTEDVIDLIISTIMENGFVINPASLMSRDRIDLIPITDILRDFVERHKDDEPWSEDRKKEQE